MTELSGSPWDIGTTHGARYADLIGSYLDDRLGLTTEETWSGAETEREVILEAAEDTLSHHERSSASLYEEMVAMAGAAGITPAEAVIVGGFTDLVDVVRSRIGGVPTSTTARRSSTRHKASMPRPGICTPRPASTSF